MRTLAMLAIWVVYSTTQPTTALAEKFKCLEFASKPLGGLIFEVDTGFIFGASARMYLSGKWHDLEITRENDLFVWHKGGLMESEACSSSCLVEGKIEIFDDERLNKAHGVKATRYHLVAKNGCHTKDTLGNCRWFEPDETINWVACLKIERN